MDDVLGSVTAQHQLQPFHKLRFALKYPISAIGAGASGKIGCGKRVENHLVGNPKQLVLITTQGRRDQYEPMDYFVGKLARPGPVLTSAVKRPFVCFARKAACSRRRDTGDRKAVLAISSGQRFVASLMRALLLEFGSSGIFVAA